MSTPVTAIVVASRSARDLSRTLAALAAQQRAADRTVVILPGRDDEVRAAAREAAPELLVTVAAGTSFGDAIDAAVVELGEHAPKALDGWLWLFEAGDDPDHDALEHLLATVERNPSLAITGPKLVRADDETIIAELGQTVTRRGERVPLHGSELDQGQFDDASDVLAVARSGMLVRASGWIDLSGFDPGLPAVDDALDFSTRSWLADGRVIITPEARVRVPERPEPTRRETRTAQLHRLVASGGPFDSTLRRILLIPAALVGIVWHLIRKRPGRIAPDLAAAFDVAFGRTRVGDARKRMASTTTQPPRVIERLIRSEDAGRRERAVAREERRLANRDEREQYALVGTGGAWVLLISAVVSVALLLPMLGRVSLAGGALLPLSGSFVDLWANVGYGVRDVASGAFGVADPFAILLALLGSVTFWNPSLSIVVLWLLAMPLAALTAWYLAARLTLRPWLRAVAAFVWMLSPTLMTALSDGRIAGVIVHILLPLLFFCGLRAIRTWTGVAQTALVAAAVLACAPSLWPVMLLLWLITLITGGRRWYRMLPVIVPAAALFAPLAVTQWNRGRPLSVFADPGVPLPTEPTTGAAVGLGFPDTGYGGWATLLAEHAGTLDTRILLAACLLPLAMLAVLGLVLPAWRVAAWSLFIALIGLAWAALTGGISLATIGPETVALATGPAQSLCTLGLIGAAIAGLALASRATIAWSVVAIIGVALLAAPAAVSHLNGTARVGDGASVTLPAIVQAQAEVDDEVATLIITPLRDGSLRVRLDRGIGETLDERSTLRSTSPEFTDIDAQLAELAVTLASSPTSTPTSDLHALGIAFVYVEQPQPGGATVAARVTASLDSNPIFQAAGETSAGSVWRIVNPTVAPADDEVADALGVSNLDTWVGRGILAAIAIVLLATVILALPTGPAPTRREIDLEVAAARRRRLTIDPPEHLGGRGFGITGIDVETAPGYDPGVAGDEGRGRRG